MVTDGQVVLQSERLQHDAVSYWERQTQVVARVTWTRKLLLGRFNCTVTKNVVKESVLPDVCSLQRVSPVETCWVLMLGLMSGGR